MHFELAASREMRGEWWVPGHRHAVAPGLLSCGPFRGARLEIDLPGANAVLAALTHDSSAGMLLGETNEGLPVTLLNCQSAMEAGMFSASNCRGSVTVPARFVVGRLHFGQDATDVNWLSFGFPGLAVWLGHGLSHAGRQGPPQPLSITLEPAPPFEVCLPNMRIVGQQNLGLEVVENQTIWHHAFQPDTQPQGTDRPARIVQDGDTAHGTCSGLPRSLGGALLVQDRLEAIVAPGSGTTR